MQKHILVLIFSILACSPLSTIAIPTQSAQHPSSTFTHNADPGLPPEYERCSGPSKPPRFPLLNAIYNACKPDSGSGLAKASELGKHYDTVFQSTYGTGPAATSEGVVFFSAAMQNRPIPRLFEKDYGDGDVMKVVQLIAFAKFGAADPRSSFLENSRFGDQLYNLLPYVKQVVDALKSHHEPSKRFTVLKRRKFKDFETYLTNSLESLENAIEFAFKVREHLHTRDIEYVYGQDGTAGVKTKLAKVKFQCKKTKFEQKWEWADLYHKLVVYAKFLGQMQEDAGDNLDSIQYEMGPIIGLLDGELPKIPKGYLKTYLQEGREFLENRRNVLPGYQHGGGPPGFKPILNSIHGAGVAASPQVPPP